MKIELPKNWKEIAGIEEVSYQRLDEAKNPMADELKVDAHNLARKKVGKSGVHSHLLKRAPSGYEFDKDGSCIKKK